MKTTVAAPPPAPAPVDPGKSSLDYINAMADPELQAKLLASEQAFRPGYGLLNLQDMEQYMLGAEGQQGALDLFGIGSDRAGQIQARANTFQREADINDAVRLGPQVSAAFRAANPELQATMAKASALQDGGDLLSEYEKAINAPLGSQNFYQQSLQNGGLGEVGGILQGRAKELAQSRGQLTPDEMRSLQQSTREAYAARGTEMGSGAISAEALSRLTNERVRMQEDLGMASQLNQGTIGEVGQNRGFSTGYEQQGITNQGLLAQLRASQLGQNRGYALQLSQMQAAQSIDPLQAILGRQSGALQYGAGQQGFAGNLTSSMQGPQLFDPNAGINLALQNNANTAGYQSNIYGAQSALAGAKAGATGQMIGAGIGALGMLGGAAIICWVAREVYGADNPRWLMFRHWLFNESPSWLFKAYIKYGERFAAFISNKPRLKSVIRRWMNGRIASLYFN